MQEKEREGDSQWLADALGIQRGGELGDILGAWQWSSTIDEMALPRGMERKTEKKKSKDEERCDEE